MPTTTRHGLPSPASSVVPDVPVDIKALADATDLKLPYSTTSTPAHSSGLIWRNPTTGVTQMSDGAAWQSIMGVAATTYTPTVTMDTPNGTATGRYWRYNKDCYVVINFSATAGVSLGTSAVTFTLPFQVNSAAFHHFGTGFWSASGLFYDIRVLAGSSSTTAEVFGLHLSTHALVRPGQVPFSFASGDYFRCALRYETV